MLKTAYNCPNRFQLFLNRIHIDSKVFKGCCTEQEKRIFRDKEVESSCIYPELLFKELLWIPAIGDSYLLLEYAILLPIVNYGIANPPR